MQCKNCEWFVKETRKIGDYQHTEALIKGKGFCLIQDFYTWKKPKDVCDCRGYLEVE